MSAALFNISEQYTFTIAASASDILPSLALLTASLTIRSAALNSIAISANLKPVAWNFPIGCPNCFLVEAQSLASSNKRSAFPQQDAPTQILPMPSHFPDNSKPFPSSPRI